MEYAENNDKTPSLNREGRGGSPFLWHPCGTRDTLPRRVPALCTKAMWHPCTLNRKISRARARPTTLSLLYFQIIPLKFCILRIIYSPHYQKGCNPIHRVAAFLSFIAKPSSRASSPINPLRLPRDSGEVGAAYICQMGSCRQLEVNPIAAGFMD